MARITVRVTPRASRDSIGAMSDQGVVPVRVTAPPADGAANAAVTKLLAAALGLPSRDVVLATGASSRLKQFDLPLTEVEVRGRLEGGARR